MLLGGEAGEGPLVFGGFVVLFIHSVQSGSLIYDPITYR